MEENFKIKEIPIPLCGNNHKKSAIFFKILSDITIVNVLTRFFLNFCISSYKIHVG